MIDNKATIVRKIELRTKRKCSKTALNDSSTKKNTKNLWKNFELQIIIIKSDKEIRVKIAYWLIVARAIIYEDMNL
jgi:hypothetical protein